MAGTGNATVELLYIIFMSNCSAVVKYCDSCVAFRYPYIAAAVAVFGGRIAFRDLYNVFVRRFYFSVCALGKKASSNAISTTGAYRCIAGCQLKNER